MLIHLAYIMLSRHTLCARSGIFLEETINETCMYHGTFPGNDGSSFISRELSKSARFFANELPRDN